MTTPASPDSLATIRAAVEELRTVLPFVVHRDDDEFECREHRDGPDTCDCGLGPYARVIGIPDRISLALDGLCVRPTQEQRDAAFGRWCKARIDDKTYHMQRHDWDLALRDLLGPAPTTKGGDDV